MRRSGERDVSYCSWLLLLAAVAGCCCCWLLLLLLLAAAAAADCCRWLLLAAAGCCCYRLSTVGCALPTCLARICICVNHSLSSSASI